MRWLDQFKCRCTGERASLVEVEPTPLSDTVVSTSPALILARSLTDPETRDEWTREVTTAIYTTKTTYINEKRDIRVSHWWSYGGLRPSTTIYTPFTLNKAEERVVKEALEAFDAYTKQTAEIEALARLTAQRIEARQGGNAETGSIRKDESPVREADAPKTSQ